MPTSLVAILVAVPLIAIFFVFVLLPRLSRDDAARKGNKRRPWRGLYG